MKAWVIVAIGVVALLGLIIVSQGSEIETGQISQNQIGVSEKGIILTEVIDFECPGCASYHPVMKLIRDEYKDRVIFAARHNPLRAIHPSAQVAHQAAEAAAQQGKFWEMHDLLFEKRLLWIKDPQLNPTVDSTAVIEGFARDLGLDMTKFQTDFKSDYVNKTINADINWANLYRGPEKIETPTFFIEKGSGEPERLPKTQFNSRDPDSFRTFLDEILGVDSDAVADGPEDDAPTEPTTTPDQTE